MTGSGAPRDIREWQLYIERKIRESRNGPITLIRDVEERVVEQEQVNTRVPAAPVEVTTQTATYSATTGIGNYNYRAVRLLVDFPDVTKATDGTNITIERYELWARETTPTPLEATTSAVPGLAVPGLTIPGLAATDAAKERDEINKRAAEWAMIATSTESGFRAEDFVPGSTWEFAVRAIGTETIQPGRYSALFTVVMTKDTTPPPQPLPPVVVSERGTLIISSNGQAVTGAMPSDFSYMVLAQGTGTSPTNEVARFGRNGGTYVAADLAYYDTQFFRLQAVDESGNRSPWSEQAIGYVEPLVDTDVILSEIDAAKTHLINVDAGVSILEDTIITKHLRITEDMSASIGKFLYLKAGQIDVNDLWADQAFLGVAEARLFRGDLFIGKQFEGGQFTLTNGGKFQTNVEDLKGVKLTEAGIKAWSPSGVLTYDLSAATGDVVATGTFYTDLTGSRVRIADRENIAAFDAWADSTDNHTALFEQYNPEALDGGASHHMLTLGHYKTNTVRDAILTMSAHNITLYQFDFGYVYITASESQLTHKIAGDPLSALSRIGVRGGTDPQAELELNTNTRLTLTDDDFYVQINGGLGPNYYMTPGGGHQFHMGDASAAPRDEYFYLRSNEFYVQLAGGNQFFMGAGNWNLGSPTNVDGFGRGRIIGGQDNIQLYSTGSGAGDYNWIWLRHASPTQMTGGVNVYGDFTVFNGTKNFAMSHPTKYGRELVHAATESPYSGIEDWGDGRLNADGFWIVVLPEYFEAIAAQDHRLVKVYSPSGAPLTWTQIHDGQFMVEGEPGVEFGWEVKARRQGYEFEVEPWVDGLRNAGEPERTRLRLGEGESGESLSPATKEKDTKHGSGPAEGNRSTGEPASLRDYLERRARSGDKGIAGENQ